MCRLCIDQVRGDSTNSCVGYVLEKRSGGKDMKKLEGEVSNFKSRAEFQNITYWNHDTTPSAEDPLPLCFHLLTVANAVSFFLFLQDLLIISSVRALCCCACVCYSIFRWITQTT